MGVTRAQVEELAALARLRLSEIEIDRMTTELADILAHAAELEAAATSADAGGDRAIDPAPLAADSPPPDSLAVAPADMAPGWRDGFFTLPRLEAMQGSDDHTEPAV